MHYTWLRQVLLAGTAFFPNIYWLDFHYYTNQETLLFASREDTTEYAMVEIYNGIRHRDIHICTHTHTQMNLYYKSYSHI